MLKSTNAIALKLLLLMVIMASYMSSLTAQQKAVTLTITGEGGTTLADVAVQLFFQGQAFGNGLTDSSGVYRFNHEQAGSYRLLLNYLGYSDVDTILSLSAEEAAFVIPMNIDPEWLELITVKGERQLLKREQGRLIMDIEGSNALGNNALDILKNAPGVLIQSDNISFLSKSATIYLDGKPSKYSLPQLMNILAKKGAYSIKRIELIANPDAAYDASFDGRVINIVTKRRAGDGYTVGLSAEGIQRSVFTSWSTGADIYARTGDLSIYGNLGYYDDKRRETSETDRFFGNGISLTEINENERLNTSGKGLDYAAGVDYYIRDNSILGVKFSGYSGDSDSDLNGISDIRNQGSLDSVIQLIDNTLENSSLNSLNLNFKTDIDTSSSYINIDFDYDWVDNDLDNNQLLNTFLSPDMAQLENSETRLQKVFSSNRLFGFKADMKKYIKKTTIDAGIKYSNSMIYQELDQFLDLSSGNVQVLDTLRYDEKIYAAYASISGKIKGFSITVGLRSELTDYSGRANNVSTQVADTYMNWFPNIFISKSIDKKNYVSLSYARKIRRPQFQQIIPFRRYVSAFYYYVGNPALQPYFPHSVEAYYAYNNQFYTNLSFSQANDRILEYSRIAAGSSNITEGVRENNGSYKTFNATVGYNGKLQKWLFLNSGLTYSKGSQSFLFEGKEEVYKYDAYSIYASPTFDIRDGARASLNFYYNSDVFYGVSQNLSYWYFGGSFSQDIFKGSGQISLTFRDLFLTGITRRKSQYGDVNFNLERNWDSRLFILRLDYYFEAEGVKAQRSRSRTANDDIRNRLGE